MNRLFNLKNQFSESFFGLQNSSNDCYMNSIIQTIFHLKLFDNNITKNGELAHKFLNHKTKNEFIENSKTITNIAKRHFGFKQHDAHEFLIWLREKLDDELKDQNPLRKEFEGELLKIFNCKCGWNHQKRENFCELSLAHSSSLAQSLADYMENEILNDYLCSKCNSKGSTTLQKSITVFPSILLLTFITSVQLQKWQLPHYELKAVVQHYGGYDFGHYITLIKEKEGFYEINDLKIRKSDPKQSLYGYLFFYKKINE